MSQDCKDTESRRVNLDKNIEDGTAAGKKGQNLDSGCWIPMTSKRK